MIDSPPWVQETNLRAKFERAISEEDRFSPPLEVRRIGGTFDRSRVPRILKGSCYKGPLPGSLQGL